MYNKVLGYNLLIKLKVQLFIYLYIYIYIVVLNIINSNFGLVKS